MYLMIALIGNILLFILILCICKDFMYPGVIYCIPWIIFLFLLLFSNYDYDASSYAYLYFFVGSMLFELGCLIGTRRIKGKERLSSKNKEIYTTSYKKIKTITLLEVFFVCFILCCFFKLISENWNTNVFLSYYLNRDTMLFSGIIAYGKKIIQAVSLCIMIVILTLDARDRVCYRKIFFIQIILTIFVSLVNMTRNGILSAFLPFFVVIIIGCKLNNKQVMKKAIIGIVLFVMLFATVSMMKYYYKYTNGNYMENIIDEIINYGCGGFVAFQKKFDMMDFKNYNGANTFRTFVAIYDTFVGTDFAPPLVQEFISIGGKYSTNVYTFYSWYADDFGIIYALVVQFFIGIFYGKLYKNMSQNRVFGIYLYASFIYPLLMQIFQDQYFSLLSTWIQCIFYGFVLLKTNILFTRTPEKKNLTLYI